MKTQVSILSILSILIFIGSQTGVKASVESSCVLNSLQSIMDSPQRSLESVTKKFIEKRIDPNVNSFEMNLAKPPSYDQPYPLEFLGLKNLDDDIYKKYAFKNLTYFAVDFKKSKIILYTGERDLYRQVKIAEIKVDLNKILDRMKKNASIIHANVQEFSKPSQYLIPFSKKFKTIKLYHATQSKEQAEQIIKNGFKTNGVVKNGDNWYGDGIYSVLKPSIPTIKKWGKGGPILEIEIDSNAALLDLLDGSRAGNIISDNYYQYYKEIYNEVNPPLVRYMWEWAPIDEKSSATDAFVIRDLNSIKKIRLLK